jgi:hypothetical protein
LPGSPSSYGFPFHRPEPTSRVSWASCGGLTSFRQLHPLRSLPPLVRPFQLLRREPPLLVVTRRLFPSEAFSSHASGSPPVRVRGPARLPPPKSRERGSKDRQPLEPGEVFLSRNTAVDLVDSFQPGLGWPAPALAGDPSLLALDLERARGPDLQSFEVRGKRRLSANRSPAPLGFLASSPAS